MCRKSKTTAEIAGKNSVQFVDEKADAFKTVDGGDPSADAAVVPGAAAEQGQEVASKMDDDRGDTLKTANKRGPPTTKSGASNKNGVEPSTSNEGGKSANFGTRAIVEVLDRVDTPQPALTSATVDIGETTAFSVLPDEGQHDDEKFCECPSCQKKPSRSSSSKHYKVMSLCLLYGSVKVKLIYNELLCLSVIFSLNEFFFSLKYQSTYY